MIPDAAALGQRRARASSARELEELLAVAREAAEAGAVVALSWLDQAEQLHVEEKAASDDLVSQADRDAERAIRDVLSTRRPADEILGEEAGATGGSSGIRWAVDPIDGTTNYLYGRPDWAVSVAAVDAGDGQVLAGVVVEPSLGRTTSARLGGGAWSEGGSARCAPTTDLSLALVELNLGTVAQRPRAGAVVAALVGRVRDIRRGGSAAAALAQVATGRAEAYWGPGLQEWDCAAGLLVAAEAGATVGGLEGPPATRWPASGDILAAAPALWEPLRALIAPAHR